MRSVRAPWHVLALSVLLFAAATMTAAADSSTSTTLLKPAGRFGVDVPLQRTEHECVHDHPAHQAQIAADLERNAHVVQRRTAAEERAFRAQSAQPIRFVLSTEDLTTASQYCSAAGDVRPTFSSGATTTCTSDTVLTTTKRDLLVNTVLPTALSRLSAHISVNRLTSNLVTGSSCGDHTIPSSHASTGVANADYVLYVSAGPIGGTTLAWAGACLKDSATGRPLTGRANFDPEHLSYTTADGLEDIIDTAVHEVLHALGFSSSFFSVNSRSSTATKRGKTVTELNAQLPLLLAEARSFTGCSTLSGVEIEDEGSSGSAGSHFERRLYKDEVMTAAGGSKLSTFSLLALQDLGVGYTVNTAGAEAMEWGKSTGCGFHTEKCNTVAGGAGTYFCFENSSTVKGCTVDLKSTGFCNVGETGATLPSYFQYYSGEPSKGGTSSFMDACPYYQGYSNRNCTDADYDASNSLYLYGNTFASDARCHMATDLLRSGYSPASSGPRCLQTRCTSAGVVEFKVNGSAYLTCPSDGASVGTIPSYSGSVTCPVASTMCATFPSAATTTAASVTTTGASATTTTTTTAASATTTAAAGNSTSNTTTAAPATTATATAAATTVLPVTTSMAPTTTAPATTVVSPPTTVSPASTTGVTATTTAAPLTAAPTPPASQRVIDGYVRIRGSAFALFLASPTRTAQLRSALQIDLAGLLDVAAQGVVVVDLSLGSLRVNFTVTSDALVLSRPSSSDPVTAADLSARIAAMASSSDASWLASTSNVYATESSETLSVAEALSSVPESSTTAAPESISSAAVPSVAAAVGAAWLLVLSFVM